ncbi:MAG: hypothetical protein AMJ93_14240 [Anaerolineae bacterium SM23_84]|nr:MAG: hypothetical protein AMJ93_14240 [Anaerolineae bacterium SM23_84]
MSEIEVQSAEHGDYYTLQVTVTEGRTKTEHQVTLHKADLKRLAGDKATPQELVRQSFLFLLEREPKESILRSFNLTAISRYFPEYDREIGRRLQR